MFGRCRLSCKCCHNCDQNGDPSWRLGYHFGWWAHTTMVILYSRKRLVNFITSVLLRTYDMFLHFTPNVILQFFAPWFHIREKVSSCHGSVISIKLIAREKDCLSLFMSARIVFRFHIIWRIYIISSFIVLSQVENWDCKHLHLHLRPLRMLSYLC